MDRTTTTTTRERVAQATSKERGGLLHHYTRIIGTNMEPVVGDKALCGYVKRTPRIVPLPGEQLCAVCAHLYDGLFR